MIISDNENRTPVPWVNVIANPNFGTVISESGSTYTWTENAHELRLSTWSNDPVSDTSGEAFYIRDEEGGHVWSTSLLPAGGASPYITRHGFGYSVFEHLEDGIHTEMTVFVDIESAVKFNVIKLEIKVADLAIYLPPDILNGCWVMSEQKLQCIFTPKLIRTAKPYLQKINTIQNSIAG